MVQHGVQFSDTLLVVLQHLPQCSVYRISTLRGIVFMMFSSWHFC